MEDCGFKKGRDFMESWFLDFNIATMAITSCPMWVRCPDLLIHPREEELLEKIGNSLVKYIGMDDRNAM